MKWYKTSIGVTIVRILLTFVIVIVLLQSRHLVKVEDDEYVLRFLLNNYLPFFMTSFVVFSSLKWIFYKLKLVNEYAVGKEVDFDFVG